MLGSGEAVASAGQDLLDHAVYQGDKLNCDVVMKGGITSGVTYPWAVCEIAKRYRLRSIGGSSAGAIAAAVAAAAEYGRETEGAGFARLAVLPQRLAGVPAGMQEPTLLNLFQPQPGTAPLFGLLRASMQAKAGSRFAQLRTVVTSVLKGSWRWAFAGAAVGLVVAALSLILLVTDPHPLAVVALVVAILGGLVLALIGATGAALAGTVRGAMRAIPQNRFGLCSGFAPAAEGQTTGDPDLQTGPDGALGPKPLTTWLADELDVLAGKANPKEPLTLGDLCGLDVNLKMFTTNLTEGSPYTIPFQSRRFFFAPKEFDELFPPRIVSWMREHRPEPNDEDERELFDRLDRHDPELLPLPECEHFPVVVATRLSLSFPFLLSAIPLWAVDWAATGEPGRCWFSDGGITSNFPMHFFDAPLPRWPTFGINLGPMADAERDPRDQSKNLYAPRSNREGIRARWRSIGSVGTFGHAIADTMQNWLDNAQTRMPGYRDRIVMIKHTKDEGGMNLNMPPDRILEFSERGRQAGLWLVGRFSGKRSANQDDHLSWDNHRWVRFRSFAALLDTTFERLLRGYGFDAAPSDRDYPSLLEHPPSYRWCTDPQPSVAKELTADLIKFARTWANLPPGSFPSAPPCQCESTTREAPFDRSRPFQCGAPRPRPVLRVAPDF